MEFGKALSIACSTFAITNIDNMFVLVTFFAEASTSQTMTPLKIIVGQYVGFTAITVVSMIGFGASLVLPFEPIGFLGLLPILLGVWKGLHLLETAEKEETPENTNVSSIKSILKVASVTVVNGGDNIGTYIPLFSQAEGGEIAVYVVTYYILLGVWCIIAYLIMGQKHFLRLVQKYIHWLLPILYVGLGIFIIVDSTCYPWSVKKIDKSVSSHPGKAIMGCVTTFLLSTCIGVMIWYQLRRRRCQATTDPNESEEDNVSPALEATLSGKEGELFVSREGSLRGDAPVSSQTVENSFPGNRASHRSDSSLQAQRLA